MTQVPLDETTQTPPPAQPHSQQARRRPRPAAQQPAAAQQVQQAPQGTEALTAALQAVLAKADELADARADEGTGVEFVKTGWIRLPAAQPGGVWRLRAPLFGELRDLRVAHESMFDRTEALKYRSIEAEAAAENADLQANQKFEPERSKIKLDAGVAYRTVLREVQEAQENERILWWLQVLDVLCVDKDKYPTSPDDPLPAWVAAPDLPVKVVHHWRSVPLAPGR